MKRLAWLVAVLAVAWASSSASAGANGRRDSNPLIAAQWWLDSLEAVPAWEHSTGAGVVVAVADSGVDPKTPSLAGRLLSGRDFVTGREVRSDPVGHGTHVSTLIAGSANQDEGIVGVAPEARILPLRVARADGRVAGATAARALAHAMRDTRVRVVNLSWSTDFSLVLWNALSALYKRPEVLVVSAAGNDRSELSDTRFLPQSFDSPAELTVASTDMLGSLSAFSNYGRHVEVAAPGEHILSAVPGGMLKVQNGTSMAAPMVSGVAALLFSRYPQSTAVQVKQAIVSTCTRVPALAEAVECGGVVNARAALERLDEMQRTD